MLKARKQGGDMGTRKSGEQQIRNLTKNSTGTYQISVPIQLVRLLRWQRGQQLVVKKVGNKLVIEDFDPESPNN